MKFKFLIEWTIGVDITCFNAVEFWTGFTIKIPRPGSILNGVGSEFNTSGLNIQRWKMTPRVNFQPGSKYFVTPAPTSHSGIRTGPGTQGSSDFCARAAGRNYYYD
jgi:hypothetical protein